MEGGEKGLREESKVGEVREGSVHLKYSNPVLFSCTISLSLLTFSLTWKGEGGRKEEGRKQGRKIYFSISRLLRI